MLVIHDPTRTFAVASLIAWVKLAGKNSRAVGFLY
jgi:hypothetical protein